MLRLLILVLAVFCSAANAFYPEWLMTAAADSAYDELEGLFPEDLIRTSNHISNHHKHSKDMCGFCVKSAARHIMEAVVEHAKEFCAKTECPYLKKKMRAGKSTSKSCLWSFVGSCAGLWEGKSLLLWSARMSTF